MSAGELIPVAAPTVLSLGTSLGMFLHGMLSPRSRLMGPIVVRGDRSGPTRVALTFDDGPSLEGTRATLDVLAELKCRGTFFFIGKNAQQHAPLVARTHAEGHLIGNHSFDHARQGIWRRRWYWEDQLSRTDAAIAAAGGPACTTFFRPPMGFKSWRMVVAAANTGHQMVTWSVRARDGVPTTSEAIVKRIVPRAKAGDIIALHDGAEPGLARDPAATIAALPELIRGLRRKGLSPVRLDELLGVSKERLPSSAAPGIRSKALRA